jgi:hypothetical protein
MASSFASAAFCLFGLNLLSDSGRDGHGGEWRTSCSEREAGAAKKSRTGQLKHLDHASLFLCLQASKIVATSLLFCQGSSFC